MRKLMLVLALGVWMAGCAAQPEKKLDENAAIQKANEFLKLIMHGNYSDAYAQYMSPGLKFNPSTDQKQFTADWGAILDRYGALQKATLDSFQIVPGRRVIQLYYLVNQAKEPKPILYHLVLEQDKKGVFTIFIIDVGNAKPFPPLGQPGEKVKKSGVVEVLAN